MTPHRTGMRKTNIFIQPVEEYITDHKRFEERRKKTFEHNEQLIKEWNAIPWWKKMFGLAPSFEEQRSIILSNWTPPMTQGKK